MPHCTEVGFASFLSGRFITVIVVNPPESKLAKRTSLHCVEEFGRLSSATSISKGIYPKYYKHSNESCISLGRLGRQGSTENFCNSFKVNTL